MQVVPRSVLKTSSRSSFHFTLNPYMEQNLSSVPSGGLVGAGDRRSALKRGAIITVTRWLPSITIVCI
jgi:hypothetical protein